MTILDSDLPHLAPAFDQEDYDFLLGAYSDLLTKLEREIEGGKTPEQIFQACKRRMPHHRHGTICQRLLGAGRHIVRQRDG